jgi:hypothetical protein
VTLTPFGALVVLAGLFVPMSAILHVQLALCLFGGAAAMSLPALGGATITPAVLYLPFFTARVLLARHGIVPLRTISRSTFWLMLVAVWGVLGAITIPRFLEGQVQILAIDRTAANSPGVGLFPLHPVSGNITQSGYALGGFCAFLAVRSLLRLQRGLHVFTGAALLLAGMSCLAAIINLGEFYLGLPRMLVHVRTAGYRMFDAYEAGGLMRIQGTFPEASAFASFSLPLFAFTFNLWLSKTRTLLSGLLALCSFGFLAFSTSGTAYAGLAGYFGALGLGLAWRAYSTHRIPRARVLATVAMFALAAAGAAVVLEMKVAARVGTFLDNMVFAKLDSPSGIERTAWSMQAWSNFLDTYGIGVGLGSARASSFVMVLLSNIGIVGTALFGAFVLEVWRSGDHATVADQAVARAARHAVLATLIAAILSATVFDLGIAFYAFAAAASLRARDLRAEARHA